MVETEPGKTSEYKTGGWRAHYVLIVCTLLYVVNYMDRQVFAVILQPMKLDLGLTDAQCGLASTVLIFGMAFFSFPISYLIDRWSRRKAIGVMAILWSAFTFATGLARSFTGVIIPRAFVGLVWRYLRSICWAAPGVPMWSALFPMPWAEAPED